MSNTWTMPVENRLDMELTGIKTPLGMKVQGACGGGTNLDQLQTCEQELNDNSGKYFKEAFDPELQLRI